MQSNKASKKISEKAPSASVPVAAKPATETTPKSRSARSAKAKSEPAESTVGKRHRKSASPAAPATEEVTNIAVEGDSVAATPVAIVESAAFVPAVMAATALETSTPEPAFDQIAKLAHRLWLERGCEHGYAEQDWFRAEQRLQRATAAA